MYFNWLLEKYSYRDLGSYSVEIKTPFLDTNFDNIIMYAVFSNTQTQLKLTDDGWTLDNLKSHGMKFTKNSKVYKYLEYIIHSLGLTLIEDEISITTDIQKFPVAKQRLLQGLMQINDLITLQPTKYNHIFFDEVESYLRKKQVYYSKKPSFLGKEGITVQFDFSIPVPGKEKLVRVISNGNNLNQFKLLTMDSQLLKYSRGNDQFIAVIDDVNHPFDKILEITSILKENTASEIIPFPFSTLEENPLLLSNTA